MALPTSNEQNPEALALQIVQAVSTLNDDVREGTAQSVAIEAAKMLIQKLTDPRKKSMQLLLNVNFYIQTLAQPY
jgi:hypothetical protein